MTWLMPVEDGERRCENSLGDNSVNYNGIIMSDVEAIIQKLNNTGHIGTKSTQIFAYADDVAILSRNKNVLKDALGNIESAARERGLIIN